MKSSTQARSLFPMAALMLLLLLNAPASTEAAISCTTVINDQSPCANYLQNGSGMPPAACCAGVLTLASAATTTADKQAVCNCIQNVSKFINIKPDLAQALPANCGISLSFPIGPNIDCSTIT